MVSWASVAEAADTPSTKSGRIGFTTVSRLGVRSEATQKSPSSLAYGRMSIKARISRPWVARIPDSISGPTSPGSACSSSGRGTGCCSGHNRVKVASGSSRPASARTPGIVLLRPSAWCASAPIASMTAST